MSVLAAITHAYTAAALRVVNDPKVWADELQRQGARRLPWPPPRPSTKWDRLCHWLLVNLVDLMLMILHDSGDPMAPGLPLSADDPKLQAVLRVARRAAAKGEAAALRVARRAAAKGEAAVIEAWGGERITIAREYKNLVIEQTAELALAAARLHGLTRDEAFALFGLPRRRAFRAIKRKHTRRK